MRNWSKNQITIVMIRHGSTKSNSQYRYLGKTDELLSKEGEDELLRYKQSNLYPEINELFTSPMKRCIQTANILYPDLEPIIVKEWSEIDFGLFEGKNYIELKDDRRYQAWIDSNGTLPFPDGESREQFIARCREGFFIMQNIVWNHSSEQKTIGMIVHGGTIMALLSSYYGGEYFDYHAANGKGYIVRGKQCDQKLIITDITPL